MPLAFGSVVAGTACAGEDKPRAGKMNLPYFVYRDINRNGEYDLEDRPYAGQRVFLERPDESRVDQKSNIGGFVNFTMSVNDDARDISVPGQYRLLAEPASGWTVTSGNVLQELTIKALNGSPGGLIAESVLSPVGVAPGLNITGHLQAPANSGDFKYVVVVASEDESTSDVAVLPQGDYAIPVGNGVWRLGFKGPNGAVTTRVVEVLDYPVVVSTSRFGGRYAGADGEQTTVGFDDLTHSDTLYKIPNGYGGLDWHNWIATHHKFYKGDGYINGTVSGEYVAYNGSGHPAAFSSAVPFDFLSVHLGAAWPQAEKGFIEVKGWRGEDMVYRDRIMATTLGPKKFEAGYKAVTRVEFKSEYYWQIILDDLKVSIPGAG